MKAKVSSKLRGTIMLPSIRSTSFEAKDTFSMTEEQFYSPDVQQAIQNESIKIEGKTPKPTKFVKVSNVGTSSLILPEVGVLRAGKSINLPIHLIKHHEIIRHLNSQALKKGDLPEEVEEKEEVLEDKPVVVKKTAKSGPNEKMNAVAYKPEGVDIRPTPTDLRDTPPPQRKTAEKQEKKKKGIVKKHTTGDDLLLDIENGTTPGDNDGILFVDVAGNGVESGKDIGFVDKEQAEQRLSSHPTLKKGK